jgi:hypothetical protein
VLPTTAASLGLPSSADPNSPSFIADNLTAGAKVWKQALSASNGDIANAAFAYKGATSASGRESVNSAVQTVIQQVGMTSSPTDNLPDLGRTAVVAKPLTNNDISTDAYNALFPDVVEGEGLSGITPWFQDTSLITGNPRLRKEVQPVTFKIYLEDFTLSDKGRTGQPIILQLNASMKQYSLAMKHLYHQQKTRTAFHITMWGSQADIISGQCSTGVFMNQFGITDYFSTFNVDENLKRLVVSGLTLSNNPSATIDNSTVLGEGGITGGVVSEYRTVGSDSNFQTRLSGLKVTQSTAFRVAAQDAFQELLSLFKMNGSVWLWNKIYSPQSSSGGTVVNPGNTSETRDWTGIDAWSPALGLSAQQMNGRNNDALTRGSVVMQFRNFVYEGYFKSLTWTMDASNPFRWDFSFTFQVERTVGRDYIPGQP